jgi:hypothetical protein
MGTDEKGVQHFGPKDLTGRDYVEDLGVDERMMMMMMMMVIHLSETGCGGVDCIRLAQDRDQWRALVNAAVNLLVPQKMGNL